MHFAPSLPTRSLCSLLLSPSLSAHLTAGRDACWGRDAIERDVSGHSGHPLGWGDSPGQRQGCDGGARRTSRARGVGGERGSARAAVLGCVGCRLWGSPGSLQKGAWAPKFAPVPRTPPAPPGVCRGSLECWGCKGSQGTRGEHPPCPDREHRTANREWPGRTRRRMEANGVSSACWVPSAVQHQRRGRWTLDAGTALDTGQGGLGKRSLPSGGPVRPCRPCGFPVQ